MGRPQQAICDLFHIDPLYCVGAGSMIITARPDQYEQVLQRLRASGIKATVASVITAKEAGIVIRNNNNEERLQHPGADPYWAAFFHAIKIDANRI